MDRFERFAIVRKVNHRVSGNNFGQLPKLRIELLDRFGAWILKQNGSVTVELVVIR
ncbi:hypothetical protein NB592_04440 [Vibrio parahaemolyticus]|uniref:hypothetical protein n=1 Tax=Vibrio parahaemolyticus TaxID=670 RepID=UPI00209C4303|nr:hypothetical protein [Vibrio parahaemolyticus]MCR9645576.1 hypothetical protein [Vibrio parahaemolyticus]MCR9798093.1 hypothetical protein [Vibrio parahaemolyticus]MDF4966151.1 hypothetical protein [Vibrio parahaemolyticus]MDF5063024.1 hypothetical protein [Vibrio parahaemolyticus]MDF5232051.1 hypothetical protein [Vibrio parahaemolyticus]